MMTSLNYSKNFKGLANSLKTKTDKLMVFLLVGCLPTIIAATYYGLIASDIYVSEARYAIRSNSDSPSMSSLDTVLSGGSATSANEDAMVVRDFILSRDMVGELMERANIRHHYRSDDVDLVSRLDDEASLEDFYEYYRQMILVAVDSTSNITTLRVRAFDPTTAHEIAQTIIELSEALVNTMSARIIDDTLRFARTEVDKTEARVRDASGALTRFRSESRSIDPGQETSAVLGIVTELESRLAEARTQLIEAKSFISSASPQIGVLDAKVQALKQQVVEERRRLASEGGMSTDYTQLIDDYEPLVLEQELAKQRYASTLTSLELARAEAQRKQRYLLPFVEPQIPDEAVEPRRLRAVTTVFLFSCLLYGIGGLIWAAVKDHMRL
jgi:capsular polysaccharide transport system permease protein